MVEKSTLPQVSHISNSPEQDWSNFQNAMRYILTVPKDDVRDEEEQEKKESAGSPAPEK